MHTMHKDSSRLRPSRLNPYCSCRTGADVSLALLYAEMRFAWLQSPFFTCIPKKNRKWLRLYDYPAGLFVPAVLFRMLESKFREHTHIIHHLALGVRSEKIAITRESIQPASSSANFSSQTVATNAIEGIGVEIAEFRQLSVFLPDVGQSGLLQISEDKRFDVVGYVAQTGYSSGPYANHRLSPRTD